MTQAVGELLTTGDAAKLADVSAECIRVWDRTGKLHARRTVGGVRLFERSDVERAVKERDATRTGEDLP